MPTFEALKAGYERDLLSFRITDMPQTIETAKRVLRGKDRFLPVQEQLKIPAIWMMASFEREASSNFNLSPAQGDPWRRKSVNEPKGRGPFSSWEASALDAYRFDRIQDFPADTWTWAFAAYTGERFNGFGFRNHGIRSAYLWAGTNMYTIGMYISDGSWRPGVRDHRVGIIPVMRLMNQLDPTLHLVDALPVMIPPPIEPVDEHERSDEDLQKALNHLNFGPLVEDGNFGKRTEAALRRFQEANKLVADGIPGKLTWAAIDKALNAPILA